MSGKAIAHGNQLQRVRLKWKSYARPQASPAIPTSHGPSAKPDVTNIPAATKPAQSAAADRRETAPRAIGFHGLVAASVSASARSLATPMANW
jgi:hypothetical protein